MDCIASTKFLHQVDCSSALSVLQRVVHSLTYPQEKQINHTHTYEKNIIKKIPYKRTKCTQTCQFAFRWPLCICTFLSVFYSEISGHDCLPPFDSFFVISLKVSFSIQEAIRVIASMAVKQMFQLNVV